MRRLWPERGIYRGWWIKIIVVVALVKALQAGLASQKDTKEAGQST